MFNKSAIGARTLWLRHQASRRFHHHRTLVEYLHPQHQRPNNNPVAKQKYILKPKKYQSSIILR